MRPLLGIPFCVSIGMPNAPGATLGRMETGKRIRALRLARGMKQKDLAKRLGIAAPSLSELETGESKEPSGPVLAGLCRELETNAEFLLTGKGHPGVAVPINGDQAELQAIYAALPESARTRLLDYARGLRDAQNPPPSIDNPFPNVRVPTSR